MEAIPRNDSASAMASLQMDYDSDEEESISRNNSINESESNDNKVESTELSYSQDNSPDKVSDTSKTSDNLTEIKSEVETNIKTEDAIEAEGALNGEATVKTVETVKTEATIKTEVTAKAEGTIKSETDVMVKAEIEVSPVDFISDDEDGTHPHHHRRHNRHTKEDVKKHALVEAISMDSPSSQGSTNPGKKATRLVSYGPDEDVDEESESEEELDAQGSTANSMDEDQADTSILSRSVQNMASDDIKIPPEPPGKCSYQLQKKIEDNYERMRKEGRDLNRSIQNRKNFRNPSIYEKLIDFCYIDEKGTNFPPDIYDPHLWGKESYYDELDKGQRKEMEKREKEKKERTKIEFLTGTKKGLAAPDSSGMPDEKKRKTKWDAQPPGLLGSGAKAPGVHHNPGVVNLTATATGTKATVISAVGSLTKKSK